MAIEIKKFDSREDRPFEKKFCCAQSKVIDKAKVVTEPAGCHPEPVEGRFVKRFE